MRVETLAQLLVDSSIDTLRLRFKVQNHQSGLLQCSGALVE